MDKDIMSKTERVDRALTRAAGAGRTAALAQWEKDGKQDCGACGGAMLQFDGRSLVAKRAEALGLAYRSGTEVFALLKLPEGIRSQHEAIQQEQYRAFRGALEFEGFGAAVKRFWTYVD